MSKILIIGSGGREHSIGYNLSKNKEVTEVIYAPGNAGTYIENKAINIPVDPHDFESITDIIDLEHIDMTIIGPEKPLTEGIVDYLNSIGYYKVFGPTQEAAKLESDKFFSYDLMDALKIPQAYAKKCITTKEAVDAIEDMVSDEGIVIKARGLTEGKGVSVCDNLEEAMSEIKQHSNRYSKGGKHEVLISERLFGEEFSVFGISDGKTVYPIECSFQDHKALLDCDKGPNTGGMGAYGPADIAPIDTVREVCRKIMNPVVHEMMRRGNTYKGFLYAGMINTKEGLKVIEFNARFGDPEAQPAMMIFKDSIYIPLSLALEGKLDQVKMNFKQGASCCVILASKGYPIKYEKGYIIKGINKANMIPDVKVFHSGTKYVDDDIVTDGGRVLGLTSYSAKGIRDAKELAYKGASIISESTKGFNGFEVFHYRKDIADKALMVYKT